MTTAYEPPFANTKLAQYLRRQLPVVAKDKSQREIAHEMGFTKPNIISMYKRGDVRVPLEKLPLLAKAIGADVAYLFRLGLEQYWPEQQEAIDAVFGTVITKNEARIIKKIRDVTDDNDPALTPELAEKLEEVFSPYKRLR